MIDGVELRVLHQLQQVRELHAENAVIGQQNPETGHEIIQIRHMSEHVIADEQIAAPALVAQSSSERHPEKLRQRVDSGIHSDLRHIACRLDTEHRNALLLEVLEEITVITRNLDYQ